MIRFADDPVEPPEVKDRADPPLPSLPSPSPRPEGCPRATLEAARSGEEWAWSRLYLDLAPVVRGYFRAHRARYPEDLTGDVFLEVARRIGNFSGEPEGFRAWVFTIAHSRLVDQARRANRRADEVPLDHAARVASGDDVEDEVEDRLRREELLETVKRLTPDQQEVVLLRVFGGLSVAEVAAALRKTTTAVKVLHHRAVRALQAHLGGGGVTKSAGGRLPD